MSLTRSLAKSLAQNPDSLTNRLRVRRTKHLTAMIESVFADRGAVTIVDVGGTERYWGLIPEALLDARYVRITLVNVPGASAARDHGRFTFVTADGCDPSVFGDGAFDIGHSNSVVEHVGDWERKVRFAREISRVAERLVVQTPNYWFPVEPRFMTPFFHWLPEPVRVQLVRRCQLGHHGRAASVEAAVRTVESAGMLDRWMFQNLFGDCTIHTERFLGLAKSFIAVRGAPAGAGRGRGG